LLDFSECDVVKKVVSFGDYSYKEVKPWPIPLMTTALTAALVMILVQ
jgi:hypothetical protein